MYAVGMVSREAAAPTMHSIGWHAASATKPMTVFRDYAFAYPFGYRPHLEHRPWVTV